MKKGRALGESGERAGGHSRQMCPVLENEQPNVHYSVLEDSSSTQCLSVATWGRGPGHAFWVLVGWDRSELSQVQHLLLGHLSHWRDLRTQDTVDPLTLGDSLSRLLPFAD